MCCDRQLSDCECEQPIDFDDVYDLQLEDLYETGIPYGPLHVGLNESMCEQCVHYQQPSCLPLRAWYKRYMTDGSGYGTKISACSMLQGREHQTAIPLGPTRKTGEVLNHEHNDWCTQNYCNDEYDEQQIVELSSASTGHPDLLLGYNSD